MDRFTATKHQDSRKGAERAGYFVVIQTLIPEIA